MKPPHLIMYASESEKAKLARLARTLGVSYSELLRLLVWPMARRVEAALRKVYSPETILNALGK